MMKDLKKSSWAIAGLGLLFGASMIGTGDLEIQPRLDFADTVYTKDSSKFQVFDIPEDAIAAHVALSRDLWPEKGPQNIIEVKADIWNAEMNWADACSFKADGGLRYEYSKITQKDELILENYNHCGMPPGKGKKLRVQVLSKENLTSQASVTFYTYKPTIIDKLLGAISPKIAEAIIAHVQSSPNGGVCASTACNVLYTSNTTAGSLLVSTCSWSAAGSPFISITDTQTNTYNLGKSHTITNDANAIMRVDYAMNTAGGSTNSTQCLITNSSTIRSTVSEFSGVATSAALDKSASAQGSGTSAASGSVTPVEDNELFFVAARTDGSLSNTWTAGTDFTMRSRVPSGNERVGTESFVQTTAAAHDGTMTLSSSNAWAAIVVTFKMQAAGGGGGGESTFIPDGYIDWNQ